jgi:deoxycytidylate deaminase
MRTMNEFDIRMFFVMESLKPLSKCFDKQVVCIIVNRNQEVLSVGINTVKKCNKECDDKEHRVCEVVHAEKQAILNASFFLGKEEKPEDRIAYVNLFPCKPCQQVLESFVGEIVTFGMAHKEWVSDKVMLFPHPFYTGKEVQPLITENVMELSCRQIAEASFATAEMSVALQDQHHTSLLRQVMDRWLITKKALELRLGAGALIAYTKSTYKKGLRNRA